ncbi:MAG: hypothetical protein U0263_06765 [Polyangiaceae bacterium]
MISSAVVDRYARAIFELGVETRKLNELSENLRRFAQIYEGGKEPNGRRQPARTRRTARRRAEEVNSAWASTSSR